MMADDYVPLEFEEEVVETADVMDLDIDVPDTEINNDTDRCIICKESSSETLSNISQGLNTIRENCDITGRRDILDYLQLMPHDTKHKIHASCRRRIAYEASKVERDKTAALSACKKRQTRSMTGGFVFHKQCFLCGEPCLDSKDMRKVLSGGEFDSSIRDMIQNVRGYDAWALEVQGRLEFVNDLFAVDAIYHSVCLSRFRTNLLHTPHKVKRGRPQNADALHAFERLCERLEAQCENELFTLSDLHKMMCELSGDGCEVYGREYFKELWQKRYGSHIYFDFRPGRNDVVGFANYCDLLLHDKFFSDLVEGEGSEAEKLVKKAASLILGDIREMECRRDCYPNASDIKSDGLQFLPPLLKTFMTRLINCPLKQASIGQAIVHAARPRRGVMLPLLFGVAVDVAQCGLNDMQIKLSRLGFSFSVDEIRRYKHSIMNMSCDSSTASDQIPTMHFVADNVDHNVRTLDGLGTFHGMGIISVTSAQGGALVNTHRVSRLEKPIKASEATQNKCVTIFRFNDSTVEGLKGVNLRAFRSLQRPITLPAITNLNLLWHAGTLLRGNMNVRPNWSGFMQSVCQGVHAGVSSVEMLSIVDLNPSDEDCIYSTLLFVANQARRFNIETPNITFDQPLYIKAVDIVMKARLDIVVRLGGFHTLMSFLGSIGHLMKGSGLEEVLGESFVISYQQYQLSTITSVFQDR